MVCSSFPGNPPTGAIAIEDLGRTTIKKAGKGSPSFEVRHHLYSWHAPQPLKDALRQFGSITLSVYTGGDGVRRFAPTNKDGAEGFGARAFQIGHGLLLQVTGISFQEFRRECTLKLAYDYLGHTQYRMRKKMGSSADLIVRKNSRELQDTRDILPSGIGCDDSGRGKPWSVEQLMQEGKQAARALGNVRPTEADVISHGLYQAALLNPLQLSPDEIEPIVKMATIDFTRLGPMPSPSEIDEVAMRLQDAILEHLQDSTDDFNRWFRGGKSNLAKLLANKSGYPGGRINRELVVRSLCELAWQGFKLTANCLGAFALSFSSSLDAPLTDAEKKVFEAVYLPQDYLGGLPLILLDRIVYLRAAVIPLIAQPSDPLLIGALHRMLMYYAEMVPSRRGADRQGKRAGRITTISLAEADTLRSTSEGDFAGD